MYKKMVFNLLIFSFMCSFNVNAQSSIPIGKSSMLSEQGQYMQNTQEDNGLKDDSGFSNSLNNKIQKEDYLIIKDNLGDTLGELSEGNHNNLGNQLNNTNPSKVEDGEIMTSEEILGAPNITVSEFGGRIMDRLLDVVGLFQNIAKPIAILFFILSAISAVIAVIFDGKNVKSRFLGMMLSVLMYVGIMYSPDLVMFFATWLSTGV